MTGKKLSSVQVHTETAEKVSGKDGRKEGNAAINCLNRDELHKDRLFQVPVD